MQLAVWVVPAEFKELVGLVCWERAALFGPKADDWVLTISQEVALAVPSHFTLSVRLAGFMIYPTKTLPYGTVHVPLVDLI